MKTKGFIKFEPIDLTQIIIYVIVISVFMMFFKSQIKSFFESLSKRPITVTDDSGTSIKLNVPVEPKIFTAGSH